MVVRLKDDLKEERDDAVAVTCKFSFPKSPDGILSASLGYVEGNRTYFFVLSQNLVMLSPQLGPLRELVLGACSVHLALQADDFATELYLRTHVLRVRSRGFAVEVP